MKIGILSFRSMSKKAMPEEILLKKAAISLGHKARIFRISKCQMIYNGGDGRLLYDGKRFPEVDVLIPRVSLLTSVMTHISIIKQFQFMRIPILNKFLPIGRAKNKLWTLQYLHHKKIPVPKTVVIKSLKYLDNALKEVHGPPVILKNAFGSYGCGVIIAESKRAIVSALDVFTNVLGSGQSIILIQEYLKEAKGKDKRVFVIGGRVVASMERRAKRGEFRSNLELGGIGVNCEVTKREASIALKATKAIGLEIGGVDLINGKNGPMVLEVNANPGFKGLQQATGIDIAQKIIEYAVSYAESKKRKIKIASL